MAESARRRRGELQPRWLGWIAVCAVLLLAPFVLVFSAEKPPDPNIAPPASMLDVAATESDVSCSPVSAPWVLNMRIPGARTPPLSPEGPEPGALTVDSFVLGEWVDLVLGWIDVGRRIVDKEMRFVRPRLPYAPPGQDWLLVSTVPEPLELALRSLRTAVAPQIKDDANAMAVVDAALLGLDVDGLGEDFFRRHNLDTNPIVRAFCGYAPHCSEKVLGEQALQTALANAETHFSVIALEDDLEGSMKVLQSRLPEFLAFTPIPDAFDADPDVHDAKGLVHRVSASTRALLEELNALDGQFFAFVAEKFEALKSMCDCRPPTQDLAGAILDGSYPPDDHCELPDIPSFQALSDDATALTAGCEMVVYSAVFYRGGVVPADPRELIEKATDTLGLTEEELSVIGDVCYVLFVSTESAVALTRHWSTIYPWNLIAMDAGLDASDGRKLSKIAKTAPHLFFRETPLSLFLDFKLELMVDPRALALSHLLFREAGFSVVAHPCAAVVPAKHKVIMEMCQQIPGPNWRPRGQWMFTEAEFILARAKTDNPEAMIKQLNRYREMEENGFRFDVLSDTAVVLRDSRYASSRVISCRWLYEFARVDSSDRDQPALTYVLGTVPRAVLEEVELMDTRLHWWYPSKIARVGHKFAQGQWVPCRFLPWSPGDAFSCV